MKRIFAILLSVILLFSVSCAETDKNTFPFKIKTSDTYDDVVKRITDLFGEGTEETDPGRIGDYVIRPEAKLYGMDIESIGINKESELDGELFYKWELVINLDNPGNRAEDIMSVYDIVIYAYGHPIGIDPMVFDYDFSGGNHVYNLLNEEEELQRVLDSAAAVPDAFTYTLYWHDCILKVSASEESSGIEIRWTNYGEGDNKNNRYLQHEIPE